jgi:trimethylamine--corrinoid protein Co-methyltransferase
MRYESAFLSTDEQARVHEEALRILAEVGLRVHGDLALPLLAGAGAEVDAAAGTVKMPRALVEAALAKAPRSFVLGARNPLHDYPLPSPVTRFAMDGTAAFARDFVTGERRYGTRQDIVDAMRVLQASDLAVMGWPPVAANDRPVASRPLHEFAAMLTGTSKHGQHELHRRDQAPYLGAILTALAGSEDRARERHEASVVYCPVAPLVHDGEMLDAYLDLGAWDVPVCVLPMPVPGTTGPASVLGNIALANAEALSSIVIFEVARPGRPVMYGSAVGSMDFRSGAFLAGTPEMGIQSAALTTMGRFYGLPTMGAGCASDAHRARGVHREADHHAAVGVGRGGHRGRVRGAGRRPDAGPGADPRGQRAGPPRPAHVRGRGRARGCRAARGHRGGRPGRQLPGHAGDPAGRPER